MLLTLSRLGATILVSSIAGSFAIGQQRDAGVSQRVRLAQDVLLAAYPDLAEDRPTLTLQEQGNTVRLVAHRGYDKVPATMDTRPPVLVSAAVSFDDDNEWQSFDASGPLVRSEDSEALRQRLATRPFTSSTESAAWLAARHAAFGPNRAPELERHVKLSALRAVLPGELHLQPGPFQWVEPDGTTEIVPGWTAVLTTRGNGGRSTTYRIVLEPFSGRIVRIVRE